MSSIGYRRQQSLLPSSQSVRLTVLLSVILHTITMSIAQNAAMSSTVPTLVHGALAAAANPLSNCSNVKSLFEAQGINSVDIPTQTTSGKFHLFYVFFFFCLPISFHSYKFPLFSWLTCMTTFTNGYAKSLFSTLPLPGYF